MTNKKASYDEYIESFKSITKCCGNCSYSRFRYDGDLNRIYCIKHNKDFDYRFNNGCKDYYEVVY